MKVNWPERLWVNSPVRRYVQERETRFFHSRYPIAPGGRFLEIGCGCGMGAASVCRAFQPAALQAVDIDQRMLRTAGRRRALRTLPVQFLAADAQDLPFGDGYFDAVFNFGIIHHLEDWQRGIAELSRVLKPGGIFYFEEIYPPLYANPLFRIILEHPRENRFYGPQFKAELAAAGFNLLEGCKESRFAILGAARKTRSPS